MSTGAVSQLWRWPVKSMAGEPARALAMDARGVGGDRTHAVASERKGVVSPLTAREAPRLLAWQARYPDAPDAAVRPVAPPMATVTAPDGRSFDWEHADLPAALAEDLGRPVELRRDPRGIQDLADSVLITFEATRTALATELAVPLDLRRFRSNIHLTFDAPAWAELGWEGATLEWAGGVVMRLLHPCQRCVIPTRHPDTQEKWPLLLRHLARTHATSFGINARVERPGEIAAGEGVSLRT